MLGVAETLSDEIAVLRVLGRNQMHTFIVSPKRTASCRSWSAGYSISRRTKEPDEGRMLDLFDLMNELVESQDHGQTAEEQDKDAKEDQAIDRNDVVVDKRSSLVSSRNQSSQHADSSKDEESERDGEDKERFAIDCAIGDRHENHYISRHAAPHGKREQEVDVRHHSPYQQGHTYSAAGRPQAPAAHLVLVRVRAEDDARDRRNQRLGEIELLLQQVRDQTEDGDEAAEDRADDIEVDHLQFGARVARHARLFLPSSRFPRGTGVCREMGKSWCCGVICMPRMLDLLFGERFLGGRLFYRVLAFLGWIVRVLSRRWHGMGTLCALEPVIDEAFATRQCCRNRTKVTRVATTFPRGRGAQWRQSLLNTNLGVYPSPAVHLTSLRVPTTSPVSSPKPGRDGYAIDPTRHYGLHVKDLGESTA
ncbi:hypothetical protein KC356_g174 [Hortaea werneckii]|nr:hypothetical protein KC356_g174 [Hortaea werneckii]